MVSRLEAAKKHVLPPPYVIKPIAEGSSVGVFIVTEEHRPSAAGAVPRRTGPMASACMCENYIPGKELTCAVMGDVALGVIEIVPDDAILRLRGEIRARAAPNTCYRLQFHQLFTKRSED